VTSGQPELTGAFAHLRRLTRHDLDAVLAVLQDPTVARWWGSYDRARVEAEYGASEGSVEYLIEVDGIVAGFIQYSEEEDPDYRHASIDIALTSRYQGRGIGPDAIRTLSAFLFDERGHHRITIDPAAANENAIRAYESVGFRRVGVMRNYEREPDGTWHDGLLMDMLAGELRG
jgi:aminoglycoside 6'-N-acetyltransferase